MLQLFKGKNTVEHRLIRNCLVRVLYSEGRLPLGDFAEEANISVPTLRGILKTNETLEDETMTLQFQSAFLRKRSIKQQVKTVLDESPQMSLRDIQS